MAPLPFDFRSGSAISRRWEEREAAIYPLLQGYLRPRAPLPEGHGSCQASLLAHLSPSPRAPQALGHQDEGTPHVHTSVKNLC